MGPELTADAFEVPLCVAVKEGIAALIGVVGLILVGITALKGLKVLPNVILP